MRSDIRYAGAAACSVVKLEAERISLIVVRELLDIIGTQGPVA